MNVKHYNVTGKPYPRREYMLKYAAEYREHRREMYKQWRLSHKEHRNEYFRKRYPSRRDKVQAYNQKYRNEHAEELKEKARAKHWARRDEFNRKAKEYYRKTYQSKRERLIKQTYEYAKAHPEIRRKCYRNWIKKNPHYHSMKSAERRVKLLALPTDKAAVTVIKKARVKKSFVCYYCKKRFSRSKMHIDHIVPISKNGTHTSDNLCISCRTCNLCKNAKPLNKLTFIQQQLLPL